MVSTFSRRTSYICSQCYRNILRARNAAQTSSAIPLSRRRRAFPITSRLFSVSSKSPAGAAYNYFQDENIDPDLETASRVSDILSRTVREPAHEHFVPSHKIQQWSANGLLRPIIRHTLAKAYPQIKYLTPIQSLILSGVEKRAHICAADTPGTGKSFAVATWLLNVNRSTRTFGGNIEPTATALVVVPNADLARQYETWITTMLKHSESEKIEEGMKGFVQAVYRTGDAREREQERDLKAFPDPHILIGTPTRLLDFLSVNSGGGDWNRKPRLVDIDHLKYVVIDEADSLLNISSLTKKQPTPAKGRPAMFLPHLTPSTQLMDYIFGRRNMKLLSPTKSRLPTNLIQLIMLSSSISAKTMRRWIDVERKAWTTPFNNELISLEGGRARNNRLGFSPMIVPPVERNALVTTVVLIIQREPTIPCAILSRIHRNVKHYIVGYDLETGLLRDAPLRRSIVQSTMKEIFQEEQRMWRMVRAHFGNLPKPERKQKDLTPEEIKEVKAFLEQQKEQYEKDRAITEEGYPEHIAAKIVESLLKHDNWPENVLIGLAPMASKIGFRDLCRKRGIHAELLSFETWNAKHPELPLGRTDDCINRLGKSQQPTPEIGSPSKPRTSLWITDARSCAGLDTPGIFHAYILHRITATRDYVSYCGRVSRHPFPDSALNETNENRNAFRGKVVSVLLQEAITPGEFAEERATEAAWKAAQARGETFTSLQGPGYKPGKGEKVVEYQRPGKRGINLSVLKAGSMFEKDAWTREAVRREKIGCVVEPYIARSEDELGALFEGIGEEQGYYDKLGRRGRRPDREIIELGNRWEREIKGDVIEAEVLKSPEKDDDHTLKLLNSVDTISVEELQGLIAEKEAMEAMQKKEGGDCTLGLPKSADTSFVEELTKFVDETKAIEAAQEKEVDDSTLDILNSTNTHSLGELQNLTDKEGAMDVNIAAPSLKVTTCTGHHSHPVLCCPLSLFPPPAQLPPALLPLALLPPVLLSPSESSRLKKPFRPLPESPKLRLSATENFQRLATGIEATEASMVVAYTKAVPSTHQPPADTVSRETSQDEPQPKPDAVTHTSEPVTNVATWKPSEALSQFERACPITIDRSKSFAAQKEKVVANAMVSGMEAYPFADLAPTTPSSIIKPSISAAVKKSNKRATKVSQYRYVGDIGIEESPELVTEEAIIEAPTNDVFLPQSSQFEPKFGPMTTMATDFTTSMPTPKKACQPESLKPLLNSEPEPTDPHLSLEPELDESQLNHSPKASFMADYPSPQSTPFPSQVASKCTSLFSEQEPIPAVSDSSSIYILRSPSENSTASSDAPEVTSETACEVKNISKFLPSPSPFTEQVAEIISDDPTLTLQDLAQFRQAQKEIQDAYTDLYTLRDVVWDKLEKAGLYKESLSAEASKQEIEEKDIELPEREREFKDQKEAQEGVKSQSGSGTTSTSDEGRSSVNSQGSDAGMLNAINGHGHSRGAVNKSEVEDSDFGKIEEDSDREVEQALRLEGGVEEKRLNGNVKLESINPPRQSEERETAFSGECERGSANEMEIEEEKEMRRQDVFEKRTLDNDLKEEIAARGKKVKKRSTKKRVKKP